VAEGDIEAGHRVPAIPRSDQSWAESTALGFTWKRAPAAQKHRHSQLVRSERLLSVRGDDRLPRPRRASGRRGRTLAGVSRKGIGCWDDWRAHQ